MHSNSFSTVPEVSSTGNGSRTTSSDTCSLSNLEPLTQEKIERFDQKIKHILMELRDTEEQYRKEYESVNYNDYESRIRLISNLKFLISNF